MPIEKAIKVLVVEGDAKVRLILLEILQSDPQIDVVAVEVNGREALESLATKQADVVLMDIDLPGLDGYETTRRIMETKPIPIVVCASGSQGAVASFRLTEAGAVAGVVKPRSRDQADFAVIASHLLQTLKLMSEIKVVRRWGRAAPLAKIEQPRPRSNSGHRRIAFVGIGASTGGPPVLQTILMGLPKDFSVPILIVQHIAPGFLLNFVDWLGQTTEFSVRIASDNELPEPGRAYVAPDDRHMAVRSDGRIVLASAAPESSVRPSVSYLFRSLAELFGANSVGILLTGMGRDGAEEMKRMRDRGALTIAQDRETSVVHGMPGEAIRIGGAGLVLPAHKIAPALVARVEQQFMPGLQLP